MRAMWLALMVAAPVAAQEVSNPPPPPTDAVPEPGLPQPPKTFTPEFASHVSFFTHGDLTYDVSLEGGQRRCRTPCTLDIDAGSITVSATRQGRTFAEQLTIPAGPSHVTLTPTSLAMNWVGYSLLGTAGALTVFAIAMIAINPLAIVQIIVIVVAPSAVLAIPGSILVAVGARRQTMRLAPGPPPAGTPGF